MANPNTFIDSYSANIAQLVSLMQTLRTQNDQIDQDPSLIEEYFNPPEPPPAFPPTSPVPPLPRSDIVAEDVTAAHSAIVQLLFAFDSGDPPQKAALYQMLP